MHAGGLGDPYMRTQYLGMDDSDGAPDPNAPDAEQDEGEDDDEVEEATSKTTKKTGLAAIRWDRAQLQNVCICVCMLV
jgi:hypothetical protein